MVEPSVTDVAAVEMLGVTKSFGRATAVDAVSLSVRRGEFFSLLGPSGCGKTTSLRMLGGFIVPDEGTVRLGGKDVTRVPPYKRDVNTVFQSYALFAHLSVAQNVAFGLKRRKVPRAEIARRVDEMLALVDMGDRSRAMPAELSGGQRQRVALARSLVTMPQVLLLDEPLGALDLKLRRQMQVELKRIQREVGITFIYVTHDQEEALSMSDRIAVMNCGRLEQVDTPDALYARPSSAFVAGFIGSSNLLRVRRTGPGAETAAGVLLPLPSDAPALPDGSAFDLLLRPEHLLLDPTGDVAARMEGTITDTVFLGSVTQYRVRCANGLELMVSEPNTSSHHAHVRSPGTRVTVGWHADDAVALPTGLPDPAPAENAATSQ
ncbi:ABC transporter ATP-binding protein [Nocardioides taihuensis]|uniref:Spermidine/putrescine import ATP-binding protein PotA n=1 Tax=Nocardioides taihuensis TaxID=1835606 RepID=A0ABW0BQI6_9ACTN